MITVLEALQKSAQFLENKKIESPRVNAEILLAEILSCKRLDLYLQYQKPLSENEQNKYRGFIARRANFEPLQYIIGNVEFYGLKFKVTSGVLIPRPETEILIEAIIEKQKCDEKISILDIGTGSGNIPITLAKNFPNANLTTIDISERAIEVASENIAFHKCNERVKLYKRDIFAEIKQNSVKYDIIVSNPPYVSLSEYRSLQKEIINFEPKNAVTDGVDGFLYYNHIAKISQKILKKNGMIFFEIGKGAFEEVEKILIENGFYNINSKKDYLNIVRVVSARLS